MVVFSFHVEREKDGGESGNILPLKLRKKHILYEKLSRFIDTFKKNER